MRPSWYHSEMKIGGSFVIALVFFAQATRLRSQSFEVTEVSIADEQKAMTEGRVTSKGLVQAYLKRIEAFDQRGPRLNALITLNSSAVREAEALDRERATKGVPPLVADRQTGALIQVRDARKVFQDGNRKVHALGGVSVDVGANESIGIVGESGSGKTTLARVLVGLEHLSSGEVIIDGISASNWASLSPKDRRRLRSTVQIVFQDPYSSLNPMRNIEWTLSEAVRTHDPQARNVATQVGDLLTAVGLPLSYAQRKPVALSGGERQRVAIARALAANPRVLICDEPVSALDVSVQAQILNLLTSLRSERSIGYFFITHDL